MLRRWPVTTLPAWLMLCALGCYGPDYPEGIPCSGARTCPPGQTCDPIDNVCRLMPLDPPAPCAGDPCGPGTCTADGDSYQCACDAGYQSAPGEGGETCVDVDECAAAADPCAPGGTCDNRDGSYACLCEPGYDGDECTDVDECAGDPCGDSGTCSNEAGGYTCACAGGFRFDDVTCVDVDECAAAQDPCGAGGACSNDAGGYTCACDPGLTFDGVTCVDIDECDQAGGDPCAPNGTCVNGDNAYSCDCDDGFRFENGTCVLIPIAITGPGTADDPHLYEDGTSAVACQDYRLPSPPYVFRDGVDTDGFYRIQPPGTGGVTVFCDMTTDNGGWTGIDPDAAAALGGQATLVRDVGNVAITCRVQGGRFEAFYAGAGTNTMVCQYDVDLGFGFDQIRLADSHQLILRAVAGAGHTTDVSDLLATNWGAEGAVEGGRGDALIGSAAHPGPVLGLGNAMGLAAGASAQFANDEDIPWPGVHQAATTAGQVLRLQLGESGSQDEGYRWTSGRIFVRANPVVAGAGQQ